MTDYTSSLIQEQLVGYWAKTKGISRDDLLKHPCIDDVIMLVNFREEFWDLPPFWKAPFNNIYKSVYQGKIPLKAKQLKMLQRIAEGMIKWRKQRAIKQEQTRQLLKAFRQNPNKKPADDIVAKAAGHTQTPPWE